MNPQVEHFLRCVAHRQFEPMPDESRDKRGRDDQPISTLGVSESRPPDPEPDYVEGHRVYEVRG
jgi:hypothetical protein